ncbi:MAG: two-component regulator propeller domain-containing protein [Chitinophagaceae bacterium]
MAQPDQSIEKNNFLVKKINLKGLPPETNFYSLVQDDDGFVWIGTLSGLYRYDGSGISRFLRDPSDSNSLTHNFAKTLAKDQKGNIWIGTFGGFMNRYDRSSGKIERVEPGLKSNFRTVINRTKESFNKREMIAASGSCIFRINATGHVTDSFAFPSSTKMINSSITDFVEYANGKFLITATSGLFYLEWNSKKMREIPLPLQSDKYLNCIEAGPNGHFWIATRNDVLVIRSEKFNFLERSEYDVSGILKSASIRTIKRDLSGRMWIGTDSALFVSNGDEKKIQKIYPGTANFNGINDLMVDKDGMVWVATGDNGLYQVYTPNIQFQTIPGMQMLAKKNTITSVVEEEPGSWLIGTISGLFRYRFSTQQFEEILLTNSDRRPWVGYLLKDKSRGLWVGTMGNGVFYQPDGKKDVIHFLQEPQNENSIPFNNIVALAEDEYGNIWMGAYSAMSKVDPLCYYNSGTQKITRISGTPSDPATFNAEAISQIEKDNEHHLWISAWGIGFHRYNITKDLPQNTFTSFMESSTGSHKISHNVVSCVRPGKNGKIWFGTMSGGMNMLDTKADSISWFTVKDGMPGNLVYRIEEDDQGILWLSTDNGIARFDPTTKSFINYNTNSGLPANNFAFQTSMKCKDGTLVFGTNDGQVVYFNPNSFRNSLNTQPVVITDIRLSNKSLKTGPSAVLKKSAWLTDTVWLSHDQRVISFEFANMDFMNPDVFTYAYKLEGFDDNWNYISDRNSITYTNLDPGTYTLLVKQANHLGIWNEVPTRVVLIVTPPFWQTWWFYTVCALAIVVVVYFLVRSYINRKLEKQLTSLEKKQAVELERNRISTELHDDMGGELSAIRLLSEMNITGVSPQQQLSKISASSGELVQKMNEIVWALNVNNDTLQGLIAYMRRYAVKYLDDVGIDCVFKQPQQVPDKEVDGVTRRNIFLLLKEALNNIVKHSHATNVEIAISIENLLQLTIHDNGKGTPADMLQNGNGNGLRNMQQRVKDLKGAMEITNHEGTTVQFSLPAGTSNTKG